MLSNKRAPIRFKILSSKNRLFRTPYIMAPGVYVYEVLYLIFVSLLCNRQSYIVTKFQTLTNFQYGVMNVRILMCPTIATLLYIVYSYCTQLWHITIILMRASRFSQISLACKIREDLAKWLAIRIVTTGMLSLTILPIQLQIPIHGQVLQFNNQL